MKITICGSIAFFDQITEVKAELEKMGHVVDIPPREVEDEQGNLISVKAYYELRKSSGEDAIWVWEKKKEAMLMHFDKVAWADAILVANYEKNEIPGYIGANTLIEMGLALYLGKKIYLLYQLPKINYSEEILGMHPIVIEGDLKKIG